MTASMSRKEGPPVRDFYALAHRGHNPHESDFHMQARLGFRRPRKAPIRLRPIGDEEAVAMTRSGGKQAGRSRRPRERVVILRQHQRPEPELETYPPLPPMVVKASMPELQELPSSAGPSGPPSRPLTVWAPEGAHRPPSELGRLGRVGLSLLDEAVEQVASEAISDMVRSAVQTPSRGSSMDPPSRPGSRVLRM
mmetsp:Transcript_50790/g.129242  ORF Transcript_50790/g.129242 Transcript_50790/m.129242 type:complete len:195 (-) Transcript_50790:117-701(-)